MTLTSEIKVELIDKMGSDASIAHAAWVSTHGAWGDLKNDVGKIGGLISYLMKHRHGTPFEHSAITCRVHAPIFVFREWHRHRIGWSYNETSGRYSQLEPTFWIPARDRKMIPVAEPTICTECGHSVMVRLANGLKECDGCGKQHEYHTSARPLFQPMVTDVGYKMLVDRFEEMYKREYDCYSDLLALGVAKEVARAVLPVGIYSSMYVTCNPRSLMAFLSLRTSNLEAKVRSRPQAEIEEAARILEGLLETYWPLTYAAFQENGRIGP